MNEKKDNKEMNTAASSRSTTTTKITETTKDAQALMDAATEKGYIGTVPDKTENVAYTVEGVTSGMPTPETERTAEE